MRTVVWISVIYLFAFVSGNATSLPEEPYEGSATNASITEGTSTVVISTPVDKFTPNSTSFTAGTENITGSVPLTKDSAFPILGIAFTLLGCFIIAAFVICLCLCRCCDRLSVKYSALSEDQAPQVDAAEGNQTTSKNGEDVPELSANPENSDVKNETTDSGKNNDTAAKNISTVSAGTPQPDVTAKTTQSVPSTETDEAGPSARSNQAELTADNPQPIAGAVKPGPLA